jgi:signal transduction histidine kinase
MHLTTAWAGQPTAPFSRRPWRAVVDSALTAATATITLALLSHGGPALASTAHTPSPQQAVAAVVTAAPILLWRRWPRITFVMVAVCATVFAGFGEVAWLPVAPALALYLLAAVRGENAFSWASIAAVIGVLSVYLAVAGSAGNVGASEVVHAAVVFAAAWFAGERTRLHHAHIADLHARAERADRDIARERELAVAEERNRIARDLHDSAAHALNVIAVRAGAARLRHEPDRDLAALTAIEELARQTINDIDQFVGTLRNSPGQVEVPPGLAALDTLVAQQTGSGHHVELTRTGHPRSLAAPTDHGVYRIVQEALTNAARYGCGTTSVRVAYDVEALDVTVTNGRPTEAGSNPSGGHGLIGMRERAASLDGELTAETVDDQFVVHARLPYHGRRS